MISENELRDRSIVFQNGRNVAAELLKTLKRDVPFETEKDILKAHDSLTQALYQQYCVFREGLVNPKEEVQVETLGVKPEVKTKVEPKVKMTKALDRSEPAVVAMVQKAIDAVSTKEGCVELEAKILKATKINVEDQAKLLAQLEAKQKAL
jgi:hypothetical protein